MTTDVLIQLVIGFGLGIILSAIGLILMTYAIKLHVDLLWRVK